jgi:hypothetical protein
MKTLAFVSAALLIAGAASADNGINGLPLAAQSLMETFPGVQVQEDQGRPRAIYGAPMTPGVTPALAASEWIRLYGESLGSPNPDLRLQWSAQLQDGRGTVFTYQQYMNGLPVEHGIAKILVMHRPINRVVLASGTLAPAPAVPFRAAAVSGDIAVRMIRGNKQFAHLKTWSAPQLVIYQGEGQWTAPVQAWKFIGEDLVPETRERHIFFVDAATGVLLHDRNGIQNDVQVTARGKATPGLLPDMPNNQPTVQTIPGLRVTVGTLGADFTDASGVVTIPGSLSGATPVSSYLGTASDGGQWGWVVNRGAGGVLSLTTSATSSPHEHVTYNNTPSENATAQMNGFIHTQKIHNWFRARSGTWDLIDLPIQINVNLNQVCNAFFDGTSINFFHSGSGGGLTCRNSAFSTVIAHEYGHNIVDKLGLGQGGFGEGFSDCCSMLSFNTGLIGDQFDTGGELSRNPYQANQQYPCGAEVHTCGQILGGVWWGVKLKFDTSYTPAIGYPKTQQFFVDWALVTIGGTGSNFNNSANPTTAIEMLTVNDDDGTLVNGTPDWADICSCLSRQNIPCPPGPRIGFKLLTPIPQTVQPNTPVVVDVKVIPIAGIPQDNTGKVTYRIDGGSWTQINMARTAANTYRATIPGQPCNTNLDYYFSATAAAQPPQFPQPEVSNNPFLAPAEFYWTGSATGVNSIVVDNFEQPNPAWSGAAVDDTAVTGRWRRAVPQLTDAQPGEDHSDPGFNCWITDERAGQQVSDYDVDDGKTTLTTPTFDLRNRLSPRVGFWLWYNNSVGPVNPGSNTFLIDISNDDGVSWVPVKVIGPDDERTRGRWKHYEFRVEQFVSLTNLMKVRFVASDYTGSIVEAAVDDFEIYELTCPGPACYANCDGSTTQPILNVLDFNCFLNRFTAGDPYANCDGSTTPPVLNVLDFNCFLNRFTAGCP